MRTEVSIYNEATGFVITSKNIGGQDFATADCFTDPWKQAVKEGIFLPVELVQDDSFNVRVVVDEPLLPEESEGWVDHWWGKLVIADGVLTITGGSEYLEGEEMDDYTEYIDVPPGAYRADFYTFSPGVNGDYCLDSTEAPGTYFRRTRSGEPMPAWLRYDLSDDPDLDPGHEDEWEDADEDSCPQYADFLLHLTTLPESEAATINNAHLKLDEGWIPISVNPRKPEKFPLGLVSLIQEDDEDSDDDE
jgi:hypothetical protein